MAENQSPTPANTPEHDKNKPIFAGTQPQQADKVAPAPAKKDDVPGAPQPQGTPETPEKKS
jgi:hypothetical protein